MEGAKSFFLVHCLFELVALKESGIRLLSVYLLLEVPHAVSSHMVDLAQR